MDQQDQESGWYMKSAHQTQTANSAEKWLLVVHDLVYMFNSYIAKIIMFKSGFILLNNHLNQIELLLQFTATEL